MYMYTYTCSYDSLMFCILALESQHPPVVVTSHTLLRTHVSVIVLSVRCMPSYFMSFKVCVWVSREDEGSRSSRVVASDSKVYIFPVSADI